MIDAGYLFTKAAPPETCSACMTVTCHLTCCGPNGIRPRPLVEVNGLLVCEHCDYVDLWPPPRVTS